MSNPASQPERIVLERIEAVESGLLPTLTIRGRRQTNNLHKRMADLTVPAISVAVINDYRIEWTKAYGTLEARGRQQADTHTLFLAASLTKLLTAATALKLVEGGLLDLDRDVNEFLTSWRLPENRFTSKSPVTLRWLLSHRAGLTRQIVFENLPGPKCPTLLQILDGIPPSPNPPVRVEMTPGEAFAYSNFGYCIVELLIEDVTGRSFPDVVHDRILSQTGMNDSTLRRPLPETLRGRAARAHAPGGAPIGGWFRGADMAAAGGLWSTPSDLACFAIEIALAYSGYSQRLLSTATVREMLTPQRGGPAGLGPFVEGSGDSLRLRHTGTGEGYQCELIAYPSRGQGAVVMTNYANGHPLVAEVMGAVSSVYDWPAFLLEKTVVNVPVTSLARYVGVYDVGLFKIEVTMEDGRLFAQTEFYGKHELHAESENEFFLTDLPAHFTFVGDTGGVRELVLRAWGAELKGPKE